MTGKKKRKPKAQLQLNQNHAEPYLLAILVEQKVLCLVENHQAYV